MRRPSLMACLVVAVAVLLSAVTEQTLAAGYWNMPGTFAQRTGHGFGGGYHAPLILGPVRCDGWGLGAPTRLPCAPVPNCGCGSCGDYGQMMEAPSSMESTVPTTAPASAPMPEPVPTPAAAAPVESPTVEPALATPADSAALEPAPIVEPAVETIAAPVRPLFDAPVQP